MQRATSRILDGVGHGYWMPKLRVVESWICRGSGGFGRWVAPFVGFGLPLGCGGVFALWVQKVLGLGWALDCRGFGVGLQQSYFSTPRESFLLVF